MSSWTPVASGSRYCAPACGHVCTKTEHDHAVECAELLARALGAGWTTRVWENLGWHYEVRSPCDRLSVHPNSNSFTAFLGEPSGIGGRWAESGDTPHEAMGAVIKEARAEYELVGSMIKGL